MDEREKKSLHGWRKEEGYKYPSPIIEPLEAIFCVQGGQPCWVRGWPGIFTRREASLDPSLGWPGQHRGLARRLNCQPRPQARTAWPAQGAGLVAEAASLEPGKAGQTAKTFDTENATTFVSGLRFQ